MSELSGQPPRTKVVGGERPGHVLKSAETLNYLLTAADVAMQDTATVEVPEPPQFQDEPDIVEVLNNTQDDWSRGDAVDITQPLIAQAKRLESWWQTRGFVGKRPEVCVVKHLGRIGICMEPIRAGAIGRVYASGACKALIDIKEVSHEYADVDTVNGGYRLVSCSGGSATIQILEVGSDQEQSPSQTGVLWATVRLQNGTGVHFIAKSLEAITPLGCDESPCPTPGRWGVYYLDPCTGCLAVLRDVNDAPVEITAYGLDCFSMPAGTWGIPHCDRFGTWWVTAQQGSAPTTQIRWAKATSEIALGSTDGTAQILRTSEGGSLEADPDWPDDVEIDNSQCTMYALTDEVFQIVAQFGNSCCQGTSYGTTSPRWYPNGTFGLNRKMAITTRLDNGTKGPARPYKLIPDSTDPCLPKAGEQDVDLRNDTLRAFAVDQTETIFAVALGCCWHATERRRGEVALSSTNGFCSSASSAALSSIRWMNVTSWAAPSSATNTEGLAACNGDDLVIRWKEPTGYGVAGEWTVIQAEHHNCATVLTALQKDCDTGKIQRKEWTDVPLMGCGTGPACGGTLTWQDTISFVLQTVLTDATPSGGIWEGATMDVYVLCAENPDTVDLGSYCCEDTCPETCEDCESSIDVEIADLEEPYDCNATISATKSGCTWTGIRSASAPCLQTTVSIYCEEGLWYLSIQGASWGEDYTKGPHWLSDGRAGVDGCPPDGSWDMNAQDADATLIGIPTVTTAPTPT